VGRFLGIEAGFPEQRSRVQEIAIDVTATSYCTNLAEYVELRRNEQAKRAECRAEEGRGNIRKLSAAANSATVRRNRGSGPRVQKCRPTLS
jgi:hypothetical protein